MKMFKRTYWLTGLPLCGKSFIARTIANNLLNTTVISTGDLARSMITTPELKTGMEKLDLFPAETEFRIKLKMVIDALNYDNVVIDGAPRFGEQAKWIADQFHDTFPTIINIHTGDMSTLMERARVRKRDCQDTDNIKLMSRINRAMINLSDVDIAVRNDPVLRIGYKTFVNSGTEDTVAELKRIGVLYDDNNG